MCALSFQEFERREWERKATQYQQSWGTVTAQAIDPILKACNLQSGDRLLDCGCGPGDLCAQAALQGAQVTGVDFSAQMITLAQRQHPNLTFRQADAEALPFTDKSFDVVTLNYLLLHLSDPKKALAEAVRVLAPQGRLVYTIWVPPQESPALAVVFSALRQLADLNVIPPAEDIFSYANEATAKAVIAGCTLQQVQTEILPTEWRVPSAEHFFNALQAGTRIGGLIELQTDTVKEELKRMIVEGVRKYESSEGLRIPSPSLLVSAKK